MDEEERRRRAIAALREGRRPGDVCAELGRSREWLAKWQRRFAESGPAGLRGHSRAPKRQARQTSAAVIRAVLAARDRLARRRTFKGSGADAVAWELELARVRPLPARRTIERILQRAGRTGRRAAIGSASRAASSRPGSDPGAMPRRGRWR